MPQLERMVETLRHESFYRTGTWIDESSGVYVGWVAREKSFSDGMPRPKRAGRRDSCLFRGGVSGAGDGSASEGARARARCHGPDYLVHLYEEDPSFPAGLNGRFHGLLTDRSRGTAVLFNDRYGMHRIYYHESKDAFYFAAEAKAILAVCPELRRMDPQGLGEFVACGCTLEDRSLFEGIHVLPRGSAWVFRNGSLVREEELLRSGGVGEPGTPRSRVLLPGTSGSFSPKPSPVFRGGGADRDVPNGGTGHPDDHGLAKVPARIPSLLHVRRNASATVRTSWWHARWLAHVSSPTK